MVRLLGEFGADLADTEVLGREFTGVEVCTHMPVLTLVADGRCLSRPVRMMLRVVPVRPHGHFVIMLGILRFLMA
jgi:hypothetical protein